MSERWSRVTLGEAFSPDGVYELEVIYEFHLATPTKVEIVLKHPQPPYL